MTLLKLDLLDLPLRESRPEPVLDVRKHLDVLETGEVHTGGIHLARCRLERLSNALQEVDRSGQLQQRRRVLPGHLLEPLVGQADVLDLVREDSVEEIGGIVVTLFPPYSDEMPQEVDLPPSNVRF